MIKESLCFDDVLLVPQYSEVKSRSQVDLSVKIKNFTFMHPIIPANMSNVSGAEVCEINCQNGGLSVLHRFMPFGDQLHIARQMADKYQNFGVSIGVQPGEKESVKAFIEAGVKIICIDIAHGDSLMCVEMCNWISTNYPNILLIAGNIATGSGARRLWQAGADIVKVGVGGGSLCSTRIKTGNGVPQLSAIMEVAKVKKELQDAYYQSTGNHKQFSFISDGGIRDSGDIVKSLCFSDLVMGGNIFAGTREAPGEITIVNGVSYKIYAGSSTHKKNYIEGVVGLVPEKGKFVDVLNKLLEGVRSGCSYQGVDNLTNLKDSPEFIKISNAGLKESHPHDVMIVVE